MISYKAIIFDLDDTLLDRNQAVDNMFLILLEECYEGVKDIDKNEMLKKFKEYDKRNYGNSDKTKVLEPFFDEFPTKYRISHNKILDFWNTNFPNSEEQLERTEELLTIAKDKQWQRQIETNSRVKERLEQIIGSLTG